MQRERQGRLPAPTYIHTYIHSNPYIHMYILILAYIQCKGSAIHVRAFMLCMYVCMYVCLFMEVCVCICIAAGHVCMAAGK